MTGDQMAIATIIIGCLSIIISVTSFALAIKTNHRMGLDWRFRPLVDREELEWRR